MCWPMFAKLEIHQAIRDEGDNNMEFAVTVNS